MDFQAHRRWYRQNHRTLGCKVTHMFGIPLIILTLPVLFFSWKIALGCFVIGWALQLIGHYVFEKNQPVFLADPVNPLTYFYAVIFVGEEWVKLLSGKSLTDDSDLDK